ncbi:Transcriptional regulator, MecI family [Pseudonocardia sp. Ae406_Ps2]|uniref:BlaI/MecI/CopY family transcriptional regulator n=1 Tax=Pseudonocardia sp. Ae406_Ps2 TaxID=1885033 RepID=UPI0006CB0B07|nr:MULTISPECIES: BlaI/MecI/CopY family transcriptional regulator [unclassified Pseudonocardia]OLM07405.1 Transcriptional regulator, MecI family [Pseudonocardia sp. Ae331_Ps2]OLM14594.1 Transcriptional regulator, MecI family [Pseudonocardia sp. Ae505_Ps2]OLM31752.1 Transcriptional regulator, MecI family [Pseudonocardia sp. Ae717_Ps2]ALE83477.1 transcriptional regulator [Pseudonocardia sp. HH130629-09]OLM00804.1 Transcriptional regulator, MecI family [Pseudonocardia sp. Ae406_Ps2]
MTYVTSLGELERAVMNVLWESDRDMTAREVQDQLADRDLATTTVLTVLGRLERKQLVRRIRDGRAHHYRPVASREDHVAELMTDALDDASDRGAALARFLGSMSEEERSRLRDLLG